MRFAYWELRQFEKECAGLMSEAYKDVCLKRKMHSRKVCSGKEIASKIRNVWARIADLGSRMQENKVYVGIFSS